MRKLSVLLLAAAVSLQSFALSAHAEDAVDRAVEETAGQRQQQRDELFARINQTESQLNFLESELRQSQLHPSAGGIWMKRAGFTAIGVSVVGLIVVFHRISQTAPIIGKVGEGAALNGGIALAGLLASMGIGGTKLVFLSQDQAVDLQKKITATRMELRQLRADLGKMK